MHIFKLKILVSLRLAAVFCGSAAPVVVLYFSGSGGVTPPGGNTFGAPGSTVCFSGAPPCGSLANTWFPDLRKSENRLNMAILVKF